MRSTAVKSRFLPAFVSIWLGLFFCAPAQASDLHGKNGRMLLRMCNSADTVKTLSVMCHSYLDGYIDAAHHYGKGKPESLTQPAAEVMQQALAERFPCKGGK